MRLTQTASYWNGFYTIIVMLWNIHFSECTFSRLVTPCETPFGTGRCVADRKCCQDFGGIIFTSDGVQTPKKELIQYRIAGINAPKSFVAADNDDMDDDNSPGHIFPRANVIGCEDTEVCCYLQPVASSEREASACSVCGARGDGDNQIVSGNVNDNHIGNGGTSDVEVPSRQGDLFPMGNSASSSNAAVPPTTTTTTTTTTAKPMPPRKVIPRIFDYTYSFDYSKMARIINGRNANKNANCWQVALSNASGVFGSGVLLDHQTVLTVAHKVANVKRTQFIAILGAYDFASDDLFTQTFYTYPLEIIIHPQYDPVTFENDIAILKIPPVGCDKPNICTVCLPDSPVDANACAVRAMPKSFGQDSKKPLKPAAEYLLKHRDDFLDATEKRQLEMRSDQPQLRSGPIGSVCDKRCFVSGWGTTRDQEIATILQETKMAVINNRDCEARLRAVGVRNYTVNRSMFCARANNDDSGTCDRDGGGPLVCQADDGRWVLHGLTALGLDNCQFGTQAPGMFVDVGKYTDWITKVGFVKQTSSMGSRSIPVKLSINLGPSQKLELRSDQKAPAGNGTDKSIHLKLFSNRVTENVPLMKPVSPEQFKRVNVPLPSQKGVEKKRFPVEI